MKLIEVGWLPLSDMKCGGFSGSPSGNRVLIAMHKASSQCLLRRKIEGFVIDRIKDGLLTNDNLTGLVGIVNKEIKNLKYEQREKTKMIDEQVKDVDSRLVKLYEAIETGKISLDKLAPRIDMLTAKKAELQEGLELWKDIGDERPVGAADIDLMRHYVGDLKSVLEAGTISEQKSFLRSFIKDIEVAEDQITINYTLPMPP